MSRQWRSDDTDSWKEGFGPGDSGSTYSVPANEGCSASITTKTVTLATAGGFANDQLVLIHQTRGTGAGNWELNKIVSGGGTTTLTMKYDTMNAYTDSGNNQAQIIEMKSYEGVNPGSISAPTWDGSKGLILAWFDKTTTTINGTLTLKGNNGSAGSSTGAGGNGIAFDGGDGKAGASGIQAYSGEGSVGATVAQTGANGSGGGGGKAGSSIGQGGGGGGGGNATAGTNGNTGGTNGTLGTGGLEVGNAALTSMHPGGGGGGGARHTTGTNEISGGGAGGAMALIFASDIIVSGTINLDGGDSGNAYWNGGGGAGGSCLLKCITATLGSGLITAPGGLAVSLGTNRGGVGSVGRIHIDYSKSFTGTTNPTIDSTLDTTITAGGGSSFQMLMMGIG